MLPFETAIKTANNSLDLPLCFDKVTTLVVEYRMVFLLHQCPQVQSVAIYNTSGEDVHLCHLDLPTIAKSCPLITHFEATASWSEAEFEHVAHAFPRLEHLCADGFFIYSMKADFIERFARAFKHVKVLTYDSQFLTKKQRGAETMIKMHRGRQLVQVDMVLDMFDTIKSLEQYWIDECLVAWRSSGRGTTSPSGESDLFLNDWRGEEDLRADGPGWSGVKREGFNWEWTVDIPPYLLRREKRLLGVGYRKARSTLA
jgi:hypothetical protein